MHPAPSVIAFSTLSGMGFGLLAWLGIAMPDVTGVIAFVFYFLGYALAVGGLLASVLHLGNKINAIKAFSQFQSSWLSREGVFAVASLLVVAPNAIARIFFDADLPIVGVLGSILCLATVFTTAMIYTQLKTVPRWNSWTTPVLFLGYSVGGGALLAGQLTIATWVLIALGIFQFVAWQICDGRWSTSGHDMESATGLGRIGQVRQLESAHSGTNYLLKEMAYQVARKHAVKLRGLGLLLAFGLPVMLLILPGLGHSLAAVAVISHLVGVAAIRWLFFAEAKHVVSLYYGR